MFRSESTARLLDGDEFSCLKIADRESEGSSSGYDSPGDSSDDIIQSSHTAKRTTVDDVTVSKVMRYSSTDVLSNSLEIILSMPDMCDVMFLVGEDKVPVYGVKAILSSRSKTMYKIIMKAQQEQELASQRTGSPKRKSAKHIVVRVRKYQPEDFRKIIQFMHCGKIQISKRSITGLYCGASQFQLKDLRTACMDYISKKTVFGSASEMNEYSGFYRQHTAYPKFVEVALSSQEQCKDYPTGRKETQI